MRHPRESQLDRRELLKRSAGAAVGLSSLGALLAACGGGSSAPSGGGAPETGATGAAPTTAGAATTAVEAEGGIPLARPDQPVTLPIFDDNPPIAAGLEPEAGPLKIYNWIDYLWTKTANNFGKKYGVEVEITTFSTMDEAVAKLASGATDFDVFFPTPDRVSRLTLAKLLQPLNHDYLPNLQTTIWPSLQDPFYDLGSQYTVPYTLYTTGIGYRADKLAAPPDSLSNPYDIFWDEAYKGKVFLLDDSREALGMVLLKNGITDVNLGDPAVIDESLQELLDLVGRVNVKVSTEDYSKVPEGEAWIHQAWSGSMVAAQYYLPEGVDVSALGYWYPPEGGGMIGSDMIAVLKSAKNPVLAHHFLNYMLDDKVSYDNFAQFVGYQPPLNSINPDRLVSDGVVPENLRSAVIRESDFTKGYQLLELDPEAAVTWQNAWAQFKAGA